MPFKNPLSIKALQPAVAGAIGQLTGDRFHTYDVLDELPKSLRSKLQARYGDWGKGAGRYYTPAVHVAKVIRHLGHAYTYEPSCDYPAANAGSGVVALYYR